MKTGLLLALIFVLSLPAWAAGNPRMTKGLAKACELALSQRDMPIEWVSEAQKVHAKTLSPAEVQFAQMVGAVGLSGAGINGPLVRKYMESPPQYTLKLVRGSETDQGGSGRCWAFAGLNVIRRFPIAAGLIPPSFEFSQSYIYWWHLFEQANNYMELLIRGRATQLKPEKFRELMDPSNYIHQGGLFETFAHLVDKYGLVPKSVMPDLADVMTRHALVIDFMVERLALHAIEMRVAIEQLNSAGITGELAVSALRERKLAAMEEVRRILTVSLGAPPTEFTWTQVGSLKPMTDEAVELRGVAPTRTFKGTPGQFYDAFFKSQGFDVKNDFAVVSADPLFPEGQVFAVKKDKYGRDSQVGDNFVMKKLNVSLEELRSLTEQSLRDGIPVWFAADISRDVDRNLRVMDPELFNYEAAYQLPSRPFESSADKRKLLRFTSVVGPNHAMVIDGLYQPTPSSPIEFWSVENSWAGRTPGNTKPEPWHMTDRWFRENVFQGIFHKSSMPAKLWDLWVNSRPTAVK